MRRTLTLLGASLAVAACTDSVRSPTAPPSLDLRYGLAIPNKRESERPCSETRMQGLCVG
jgi:hypothetical protein